MSVIKLMDLQMLVFTECLPTACVRTLNQDRKHTIQKKLNINQSTKSTDRYFCYHLWHACRKYQSVQFFHKNATAKRKRQTLSIKTYHQTSFNIKRCFFHTFLKLDKIQSSYTLYGLDSWIRIMCFFRLLYEEKSSLQSSSLHLKEKDNNMHDYLMVKSNQISL